ncbi:MAG TPA: CaiB/BaiF CoA-transferase family protein, partial [Thermodesulfobacteriota bacterium]
YRDKAAFDVIVQSMAGLMSVTGFPGGEPARAGISVGDVVAGLYAVQAISTALYQRERTGRGCSIDVSMFDCLFSFLTYYLTLYQATGEVPGPQGSGHPTMVPGGAFPTSDGYVTIAAFNQGFWKEFCQAAGHPEWIEDPKFATPRDRMRNRDELIRLISAVTRQRSTSQWIHALSERDIPHGPVWNVAQAMASDQAVARSLMVSFRHPVAGDVRVANYPVKISEVETGVRMAPPALCQDTDAVLKDVLGLSDRDLERLRQEKAIG